MASLSTARTAGMVVGAMIALAIPVSNGFVAILWANGLIQPDPDGSFVRLLEAPGLAGVIAAPVGIAIAAASARVRGLLAWFNLIVVGTLGLTILWFLAVASLGGLAGEPF
jgi:hypothetical protein